MLFRTLVLTLILIVSAASAHAESGVVIRAGDVMITEDRIEAPGVSIRTGNTAPTEKRVYAGAAPAQASTPSGQDFTNAEMNGMNFAGRDLAGAVFVNASLQNANFDNANLRGADFTNADLTGANMAGANLENANLTNVTLAGAHMMGTNLTNATLTNADMSGAIMQGQVPQAQIKSANEIRRELTPAANCAPGKSGTAPANCAPAKVDLTVNFDFNSDTLTEQGRQQIAQIADALAAMGPAIRVRIEGHTDNVGSDDYNDRLSTRRANSVVRELETIHHVSGSNLMARGYGEASPIATNETDLGRAKNRRVTLVNVTGYR